MLPDQDELYIRGSEVAELLHVSAKTVSRWAKQGKLPHRRTLGGHRRYAAKEIHKLVRSLAVEADGGGLDG